VGLAQADEHVDELAALDGVDPSSVAIDVINVSIGFGGIFAIVLTIIGAIYWIVVRKDKKRSKRAKLIFIIGIILFVVLFIAYSIIRFMSAQVDIN